MLDRYLWGKVSRISPEAPVPIVDVNKEENRLGGAANVALNLHALGARPILCGYVGEDEPGAELIRLVHLHGFPTELIQLSKDRRTTVKTRVLGNHQQVLRVDKEDRFGLNEQELERIKETLAPQLSKCGAVLFQDYDKGLLIPDLISWVISECKGHGIPVVVDPKFEHFFNYGACDLFKPNLKELNQGLNLRVASNNLPEIEAAISRLRAQMPHKQTLVTLGSNGMLLVDAENRIEHFPAHERAIADVSGAGDTVVSVVALGIAVGISLKEAVFYANLAGGLVCEEVGVVPIDPKKLIRAAREE